MTSYVLRDEFTTTEAAPMASPRTCEPGPGTLTLVDTTNKLSVSGGKLVFAANATGDPGAWGALTTRLTGRMLYAILSGNYSGVFAFGQDNNQAGGLGLDQFRLNSTNLQVTSQSAASGVTLVASTVYELAIISRTAGAWYLIRGGAFTDWTLIYITAESSADFYPALSGGSQAIEVDDFTIRDLGAPWDDDLGVVTDRIASPVATDEIAHEADGAVEFTWTPASSDVLELDVRRTDADNRWIVRCDQAGGTIRLIERNGGTETQRSSVSQTWTVSTAYRIVVLMFGNTIRTYVANVARNAYQSASFNNTATVAKTSHAGSELVSWPRDLDSTALAALEEATGNPWNYYAQM